MSNIDKQALPELRERFEAWWEVNYHNGNPPRFGWAAWRDGGGYKIDDDESELDGMWQAWQAAHSGKLEAAEKRIAELEQDLIKPLPIGELLQRLENQTGEPWGDHYLSTGTGKGGGYG